jgi:hypothetical protein
MSLETSRYQRPSSEAAASDVTATILLPVSPRTEFARCIWEGVFHILLRTQLVLTGILKVFLQPLQLYT